MAVGFTLVGSVCGRCTSVTSSPTMFIKFLTCGTMFSPKVTRKQVSLLEQSYKFQTRPYSVKEVQDFTDRLSDVFNPDGTIRRKYTPEEEAFVINEILLTKADFEYFAERYLWVKPKEGGLKRMYPLLDSQKFIIHKLAKMEDALDNGTRHFGFFVNLLKGARQIGGTTLAEAVICHRVATQDHLNAIIASDKPEDTGSAYLYNMLDQFLTELPPFLRPKVTDRIKNREIRTDGGSQILVGAGRSTRGTTGRRGQLGRGTTMHLAHLSELSTWENAAQIDDALLPAIPKTSPRVFVMFESTAKGRHNWWHRHWKHSKESSSSPFYPIFIPWYAETSYSYPAPVSWSPSFSTQTIARRIEETSYIWMDSPYSPTRDQLYWYEMTRKDMEEKGAIKKFLEEYGALDDSECFQHSGDSVFSTALQQTVKERCRPLLALCEILPKKRLAVGESQPPPPTLEERIDQLAESYQGGE